MLNEYERERIRRAFYLEHKSIYRIAKEEGYSHQTIEKVLSNAPPKSYHLSRPRPSPVFGPYLSRVEALLQERERMPRKQRYTAHKIFEILQAEGYQGYGTDVCSLSRGQNFCRFLIINQAYRPKTAQAAPGQGCGAKRSTRKA